MYGLINRAIEELVRSTGDDSTWMSVCERADVDSLGFEGMSTYDDSITLRLVESSAIELGVTEAEILERFGRYWVIYTGAEGWGPILDSLGHTVLDALRNLNDLHLRVRSTMPDLAMPMFYVRHGDDQRIDVEYHSTRDGLAPMVRGLLMGMADRYDEQWRIDLVGHRVDDGFDTFCLTAVTTREREISKNLEWSVL